MIGFETSRRRRAGDDVQDAGRQPAVLQELREREHRERGLLGGLHHHRAAGGDRRADLARPHRVREVPGGDEVAGADRLAHHQHPALRVAGDLEVAVDPQRLAREPAEELGGVGQLRLRLRDRLAHLEGHQQRQVVGPLVQLENARWRISERSFGAVAAQLGLGLAGRVERGLGVVGVASATSQNVSPVAGSSTARVAPPEASRHSPADQELLRRGVDDGLLIAGMAHTEVLPERCLGDASAKRDFRPSVLLSIGAGGDTTMKCAAITLTLVAALALPAGAGAKWVVPGKGFGHGVGMSQYGAFGFAKHGPLLRQDPAPLLQGRGDQQSGHAQGAGPARPPALVRSPSATPPRPAARASTRTRTTRSG